MADVSVPQPDGPQHLVASRLDEELPRASSVPDYYAILGVDPDSPQELISIAYRRQAARAAARRWRPNVAAQQLKLLNAAYTVLGNEARRADYDRSRHIRPALRAARAGATTAMVPRAQPRMLRPTGRSARIGRQRSDLIILALIAALALGAVVVVVGQRVAFDVRTPLTEAARLAGFDVEPRFASEAPPAVPAGQPTTVATQASAAPTSTPVSLQAQFEGTKIQIEPAEPEPLSRVTVTTTVVRSGRPVADLPLYLVAHFRTVEERWPQGTGTVRTNERGVAQISFNIGNATRRHPVNVDVIAEVEGERLVWEATFTPR